MGAVCCAGRDSSDKEDCLAGGFPGPTKGRSISAGGQLRLKPRLLVMLDFDQTITVFHVFKTLAGWQEAPGMAGRGGACTELGQLRLIRELDRDEAYGRQGGFSKAALGGAERLERIRWCFLELRKLGCKLVVATKGLVGPSRRVLRDLRLLELFDEVYGRTDEAYEGACTDYDHVVQESPPTQEELQLLSEDASVDWDTKANLLARLQAAENVGCDETFLVEDDAQEIQACSSIAKTLFVSEAAGMPDDHLVKLMSAARGGTVMSNTHQATSWKVGDKVAVWCSKQLTWLDDGYVCEVNDEYIEVLYSVSSKSVKVPHSKAAEWIRVYGSEVRARKVSPANDGLLRVLGMTCSACSPAKQKRPARDLEVRSPRPYGAN